MKPMKLLLPLGCVVLSIVREASAALPGGPSSLKTMPATDAAFTGGHGKLRDLDLGTARTLLSELTKVVQSPEAEKRLQDALTKADKDPQQQKMRKAWGPAALGPREKAEMRMQTIGPILEELGKPAMEMAGSFKGGFMEAVLTIEQAGEKHRDTKIEEGMRFLRQLVTGQKWDPKINIGRIRELDVLATGFTELELEEQEQRIKKAEDMIENEFTVNGQLKRPLAKLYLETMQHVAGAGGIEAKGSTYVEKQVIEHAMKVRVEKALTEKEKERHRKRLNILSVFLSPKENARIAQEIVRLGKEADEQSDASNMPADEL